MSARRKLNRREPVAAKSREGKSWFYVNEGGITVICGIGCAEATISRTKLLAALRAMRKRGGTP